MNTVQVPAFGDHPWIMGVVNVTDDSFSDGGRWLDADAAIAHGLDLVADGAAIIDVGGESTRPGAHRVDPQTERNRVIPVIAGLAAQGVMCSVDTTRAEVAEAAIAAGAAIINDVSGGMVDPNMAHVAVDTRVPWILMHWRGTSDVMASLAQYDDVAIEVRDELLARVDAALAAGVDERSVIIDPGIGFAKDAGHNWEVLRRLAVLVDLGLPVLLGASRKRFLGSLLASTSGQPRPPAGREVATATISALAAQQGIWGVRVHDVVGTADALAVVEHGTAPSRSDRRPESGAQAPLVDAPTVRAGGGSLAAARLPRAASPPTAQRAISRDAIRLTGLKIRGHHGVFDYEKRDGQDFVIDVTVWTDVSGAADHDALDDTVNYAEIAEAARCIVAGPPRDLIETVATEIADAVAGRWPRATAEVTVHKPHAPIEESFEDVSVTVRRVGIDVTGHGDDGRSIAG